MDKTKNSAQKIILNNENYNNQQNKIIKNVSENEKEEDNEIIIELEISNNENENEINILCDKNELIEFIKISEDYFKKYNINPPKEFNYFNKNNTKLYLNNKEIKFNHKLKFDKNERNKIKIKSNIKLFTLSTMFYNCRNIKNIKFIKFNTNNVTNMSNMFSYCKNLSELNLSSFNINKDTKIKNIFYYFDNYRIIINKINIKKLKEEINISNLKI